MSLSTTSNVSRENAVNRTDDAKAVAAVMDAYIAGTKNSDVAGLKKIIHPDASMSGYFGPNIMIGTPQPFYDQLEANEVGPEYAAHVVSVVVTGNTALGRIIEDNLLGLSFVNDFHLIKMDGDWLIISKLYHHDNPKG